MRLYIEGRRNGYSPDQCGHTMTVQELIEYLEQFDGGEIVRNLEADRLQILFDEKPDEATRAKLKQNGFRWSPTNSAWQRKLTPNAEIAARRVFEK